MAPIAGRLVFGADARHRHMVCHCVLLELPDRLVLVDSGFGLADIADPRGRLGGLFLGGIRPQLDSRSTAVSQIEALGFAMSDVRDIVLTHMDVDHIGGIADFPHARIHVTQAELDRATTRPTFDDRLRYHPAQWAHGAKFRTYAAQGEPWFGFSAVRSLDGLPPELLLIELAGHSRGHVGIAIDTGARWLLHCGDAYFHRSEVAATPSCPAGLRWFQRFMAQDNALRVANQARLRVLAAEHRADVRLFCAHDVDEYEALAQ